MDLPESPAKAAYSADERTLIRDQLLAYCEQHQIGTPTLQTRIATASDRQGYELSNKTLQRFLAGATRTNDAFVWLCHKFLDGTESERPVVSFGRALCAYYQHETDANAIIGVAGTYEKTGTEAVAIRSGLVIYAWAFLLSLGENPQKFRKHEIIARKTCNTIRTRQFLDCDFYTAKFYMSPIRRVFFLSIHIFSSINWEQCLAIRNGSSEKSGKYLLSDQVCSCNRGWVRRSASRI